MINLWAKQAILFYRIYLSPFFGGQCRHFPSCSQYAEDCFENFHFFKAFAKTAWRLVRCQPLGTSGYDPAITSGQQFLVSSRETS